MGYLSLFKKNPRTLGFGFLNAFFSGLGQTHFVSLLSPVIMTHFALTGTEYGSLYSLVTLISGFSIVFIGPFIDRWNIRLFSAGIGFGLIASLLFILPLSNLWVVGAGLFGLRLFGQGLCTSVASIAMARYFENDRGKALSLSQLGYPVYEGLVTPLGALLLGYLSLQNFLLLLIVPVLLVFIPLSLKLTSQVKGFNHPQELQVSKVSETTVAPKSWSRKEVFSHPKVYLLIPQTLMPPFALTGLFFHQALIADFKGWTLSLMASGLFFFAIGRVCNTFLTGPLVDKYTAEKLFPYYQIPMALGFVVLASFDAHWTPAVCFALCGLSVGSGGPIKSAIWAELYGVKHLGSIKSLFATLMILSTAASPALFGWILDRSDSASPLLYVLAGTCVLSSLMAFLANIMLPSQPLALQV